MFQLPTILLLLMTIISTAATNGLNGVYSRRFPTHSVNIWRNVFLQNLACTVTVVIIYTVSDIPFRFSAFSALLGMLFSALIMLVLIFTLKAQSQGTFAYTTIIISLSAIIPSLSGALFFKEKISFYQIIGVVMMIVCIVLSPNKTQGSQKPFNVKWLIYCMLAFFATGFIGVTQKIHQNSAAHKDEMPVFLLTAFLVGTVISSIIYIVNARHNERTESAPVSKSAFFLPIISGACLSIPHSVNLFLSGVLPSILFFPTANLCPMILNMLTSVLLFKEKLSFKQWIGILFGILSTVFVSGILG